MICCALLGIVETLNAEPSQIRTAGDDISRGTTATKSTAKTDSPAGTGRLRVVVQLDGKTRLEIEARPGGKRNIA